MLTIHEPWWLPEINSLFANGAQVLSKQVAEVMDQYQGSDAITRLRAAKLPVKVAGFVPGSKLVKLYTMDVPEGAPMAGKPRRRRRPKRAYEEPQDITVIDLPQGVTRDDARDLFRNRFSNARDRIQRYAAEERERLAETGRKVAKLRGLPEVESVDPAPKRMITLEDEI